jgi:hypothetical protein
MCHRGSFTLHNGLECGRLARQKRSKTRLLHCSKLFLEILMAILPLDDTMG